MNTHTGNLLPMCTAPFQTWWQQSGNGQLLPEIRTLQFSSKWYLGAQKSPYVLHPISQKFLQQCFRNTSNVHLIREHYVQAFAQKHNVLSWSSNIKCLRQNSAITVSASDLTDIFELPYEWVHYCIFNVYAGIMKVFFSLSLSSNIKHLWMNTFWGHRSPHILDFYSKYQKIQVGQIFAKDSNPSSDLGFEDINSIVSQNLYSLWYCTHILGLAERGLVSTLEVRGQKKVQGTKPCDLDLETGSLNVLHTHV